MGSHVSFIQVNGRTVDVWLTEPLKDQFLGGRPRLHRVQLESLANMTWPGSRSPAEASAVQRALDSHYAEALLLLAEQSRPSYLLRLILSRSNTNLFDETGRFQGQVHLLNADSSGAASIQSAAVVAALADPDNFQNSDRTTDELVLLLSAENPDLLLLHLDVDGDQQNDFEPIPLDVHPGVRAANDRLVLDPRLLLDVVLEVRNPSASEGTPWSHWTAVPLLRGSAGRQDLNLLPDPGRLSAIPADWQVRLSYDDLLTETIRSSSLEAGVFLQFDDDLIREILAALGNGDLHAARLSLGPTGDDAQYLSFDLGTGPYLNTAALYTAIGTAGWVRNWVDRDQAVLALQALSVGQDLVDFQVHLTLQRQRSGPVDRVFNAAQLVQASDGRWEALDPDGFSLRPEGHTTNLAIDRYGDQDDRLGETLEPLAPPQWSTYQPWFSIRDAQDKPWSEQYSTAKTIELQGSRFDSGDDLLVHLRFEEPNKPGEWHTAVLLFDLHTAQQGRLTIEARHGLPADYIDLPVLITHGESLSPMQLLDAFAHGLADVLSSGRVGVDAWGEPGFTLSPATRTMGSGGPVLTAQLDFPAPQGEPKPLVSLRARLLNDPSNQTAYAAAHQAYLSQASNSTEERLINTGERTPEFHSAWINPSSESVNANRTITLNFKGIDPIAPIGPTGSQYTPGSLRLVLDGRVVDPVSYSVEVEWGDQVSITMHDATLSADSQLSLSLTDAHGFVDTAGRRLRSDQMLLVNNQAAWQRDGFDPARRLLLDARNSSADHQSIRLQFYGSPVAVSADTFEFRAFNTRTGSSIPLKPDGNRPALMDGQTLIVPLASAIASDLLVEVRQKDTDGQLFAWQLIENRARDEEGPLIRGCVVEGNRLSLFLHDPNAVYVNDNPLSATNLPSPSDVLINAKGPDGSQRTLAGVSIIALPSNNNQLLLELETAVLPEEELTLTYQGIQLRDTFGNAAELRNRPVENHTVTVSEQSISSWYQNTDLVKMIFAGGIYLMDHGELSSKDEAWQLQDDYIFEVTELSHFTINLSDQGGYSLNDPGDTNLDLSLHDLASGRLIGGSWNSIEGGITTNDERDVRFVLPPGHYRLSVSHAEPNAASTQRYQLEVTHSPQNLVTTQLETTTQQLHTVAMPLTLASEGLRQTIYLEILSSGRLSAQLSDQETAIMSLYDLSGLWITSSDASTLEEDLLPGLYRVQIDSQEPVPEGTLLNLALDSTIDLLIDSDSLEQPSGAIHIDGLPVQGQLNRFDPQDAWTLHLNGGKIYSLSARGFQENLELFVLDPGGNRVAEALLETAGSLNLNLSHQASDTSNTYTVIARQWGKAITSYTLLLQIDTDGVVQPEHEPNSDNVRQSVKELRDLPPLASNAERDLKAFLVQQGISPAGRVLALPSRLATTNRDGRSIPLALLLSDATSASRDELSDQGIRRPFSFHELAELFRSTASSVQDVELMTQPVGLSVVAHQPGTDLGLQRVFTPLDTAMLEQLAHPSQPDKTLLWYRTPADSDPWLFSYDPVTGTGARMEEGGLALYIQDGGRGDDDGRVNGEIVAPGGLALARVLTGDPLGSWDVDGDGQFSPFSDGLAFGRSWNEAGVTTELAKLDLDHSGAVDLTDLHLALRHGFGTFPGHALTHGLSVPASLGLEALQAQLQQLMPSRPD
jgi:hypothetical protein